MSEPVIGMIVAVASNGVIGRDGDLPWRLPADLQYFRRVTMGKPVLMGRKTFDSIGKPLPGRDNIVLTRDPQWRAEGVQVVADVASAVALGRSLARQKSVDEVMVIGGAELYRRLLPEVGRIYLTELHAAFEGGTKLPPIEWQNWREVGRETHVGESESPCDYSFVVYERV